MVIIVDLLAALLGFGLLRFLGRQILAARGELALGFNQFILDRQIAQA